MVVLREAQCPQRRRFRTKSCNERSRAARLYEPKGGFGELPTPVDFSPDGSLLTTVDPVRDGARLLTVPDLVTRARLEIPP